MNNKLPKVFANPVDHKIKNNSEVFSTINNTNVVNKVNKEDIIKKINNIFASRNFTYKLNFKIKTKNGIIEKRVIGKNDNYLITLDNDKILIDYIEDIWT